MSLTSITLLIVLLTISFLIVVVLVVLEHKKTDEAKGLKIKGSFEEHDSLEENNNDLAILDDGFQDFSIKKDF